MIAIAAAREAFRDHQILKIGLVKSKDDVGDGLTKEMSRTNLVQIEKNGCLHVKCE